MPYKPFYKICIQCKLQYLTKQSKSKFCSKKCFGLAGRGIIRGIPFKKGHIVSKECREKLSIAAKGKTTWMKGKKHTQESIYKMKIADRTKTTGEKNYGWKGDKVGYTGLHQWVRRNLGKPLKCEHCGTTEAKKFEWANKSGEYKRTLEDWLRLCTKCHRRYDLDKIYA